MKNLVYSIIGLTFLGLNYVNAAGTEMFWPEKVDESIKPNSNPLDVEAQRLIGNAIKFLYLVAVIYALWGWFLILTAWWAEDKVKKWRTVITQALIGLVVIWLANSIVSFVVWSLLWGWTWA